MEYLRKPVIIVGRPLQGSVLFLGGPYKGKTIFHNLINIHRARKIAKKLWSENFIVICPHSNSTLFSCKEIPEKNFLDGYKILLERSDYFILMPGWQDSPGTMEELRWAKAQNIPVRYWNEKRGIYGG